MGYFLNKIRAKRESLGFSQQEMAEKLILSRENYNSFELGRRTINESRLKILGQTLSIPFERLKAWQRIEGATEEEIIFLKQDLEESLKDILDHVHTSFAAHGQERTYNEALSLKQKRALP